MATIARETPLLANNKCTREDTKFLNSIIMSSTDLQVNSLYVLLFIRLGEPVPNDFHWGLYLHLDPRIGTKYHVKGIGDGWIADHGSVADVLKSLLLVGLIRIADVLGKCINHVDTVLRSYDDRLNSIPGITCHVWLFWMLEMLQKPMGDLRILKCNSLEVMQQEAMSWGNIHAHDGSLNMQPRPISYSTLCQLQLE